MVRKFYFCQYRTGIDLSKAINAIFVVTLADAAAVAAVAPGPGRGMQWRRRVRGLLAAGEKPKPT